jgi:hypothetical protein
VTPLKIGYLVRLYAIHTNGNVQDVEVNRADDGLDLADVAGGGESDLRRTGLDRSEDAVRRLEVPCVPDGAALPDHHSDLVSAKLCHHRGWLGSEPRVFASRRPLTLRERVFGVPSPFEGESWGEGDAQWPPCRNGSWKTMR